MKRNRSNIKYIFKSNMKILLIHIFSLSKENPIILSSAFSSSFIPLLQHQNIKYFLNYHSRLIIERIQKEIHLK